MLNLEFFLKNFNELNSGTSAKAINSKNIEDSFYSLYVKHKLQMIEAWNPPAQSFTLDVDPLAFSSHIYKLKDFDKIANFQPVHNSRNVLKSYDSAKKIESEESLNSSFLKKLSVQVANNYLIPTTLFQKLIQTESGFDPKALSSKGAMGLGQIMPETAKELGLTFESGTTQGSVWHAESNLDASARYLKKLYDKYIKEGITKGEAWNFAFGAYNAGMGNIAKAINLVSQNPVITWDHVAEVLPEVTGKYSQETIRYVNRIRT